MDVPQIREALNQELAKATSPKRIAYLREGLRLLVGLETFKDHPKTVLAFGMWACGLPKPDQETLKEFTEGHWNRNN